MKQAATPLIKERLTSTVVDKTKLERDLLDKFGTTPQTAKAVAGALLEYKKREALKTRQSSNVDQTGSGASGTQSNPNLVSDLKQKFTGTGKLEDFIKAGGLAR